MDKQQQNLRDAAKATLRGTFIAVKNLHQKEEKASNK
jgi:hypothetical protein